MPKHRASYVLSYEAGAEGGVELRNGPRVPTYVVGEYGRHYRRSNCREQAWGGVEGCNYCGGGG